VNAVKNVLGIHSPSTVMWQIGVDIVTGLLNGVNTMAANLVNVMKSLIPIDAILSVNWYDVGWSIVSGIAEGISATAWWIADAAYNAARLAYEAAMAALSAGSPSKLFMKVGGWTMEGMAIGIEESVPTHTTLSVCTLSPAWPNVPRRSEPYRVQVSAI